MSTVRSLSTGEVIVFDNKKSNLYIVQSQYARGLDDLKVKDAVAAAQDLAKKGQATHFDQKALRTLEAALASVKALGASEA